MQKTTQFLILLLGALALTSNAKSDFTEGVHYEKLGSPIEKLTDTNKLEIVELFWYGCPHCFEFEPYLKRWVNINKKKVNLVQVQLFFQKTGSRMPKLFIQPKILVTLTNFIKIYLGPFI